MDLSSAHAKVRRARDHLTELQTLIEDWKSRDPLRLRGLSSVADVATVWLLDIVVEPPANAGLVAADAIHNLRAALDQAAWACYLDADGDPERGGHVYFPVVIERERWTTTAAKQLPGVGQSRLDVICRVQPFNAEETSWLRALHLLDLDDKHRSVQLVGLLTSGLQATSSFLAEVPPEAGAGFEFPEFDLRVGSHAVARSVRFLGDKPAPPEIARRMRVEITGLNTRMGFRTQRAGMDLPGLLEAPDEVTAVLDALSAASA